MLRLFAAVARNQPVPLLPAARPGELCLFWNERSISSLSESSVSRSDRLSLHEVLGFLLAIASIYRMPYLSTDAGLAWS